MFNRFRNEVAETYPPNNSLNQDIVVMTQEQSALLDGLLSDRPDGVGFVENVDRHIFSDLGALYFALLKKRGYAVYFVDDSERIDGQPLPQDVSVYVTSENKRTFHSLLVASVVADDIPLHRFMRRVTEGQLSLYALDHTNSRHRPAMEMLDSQPLELRGELLARGAVTSSIIGMINKGTNAETQGGQIFARENRGWIEPLEKKYREMYAHYRGDGSVPFSGPELFQMAGLVLDALIARMPDFPPPSH